MDFAAGDLIGDYGGDRERFYLIGHSSGAHLVSLVALDASYLAAEGLETGVIRGVVVDTSDKGWERKRERADWRPDKQKTLPPFGGQGCFFGL